MRRAEQERDWPKWIGELPMGELTGKTSSEPIELNPDRSVIYTQAVLVSISK
jgi:hypothetical protein